VVGRRKAKLKEHAMRTSQNILETISTIGIDVGKNTFHLVGLDKRGANSCSTGALLGRGIKGVAGVYWLDELGLAQAPLGHDFRLIPTQYVKAVSCRAIK
jgi:transposase